MINFYFKECRKNIIKDNLDINHKFKRQSMNYGDKTKQYMRDNKKKIIFFLLTASILSYVDGYSSLLINLKIRTKYNVEI
jgi:hypothetical protein